MEVKIKHQKLPYFKLRRCPELNDIQLKVERKDRQGLVVVAS